MTRLQALALVLNNLADNARELEQIGPVRRFCRTGGREYPDR
jgi:hypothetical protein